MKQAHTKKREALLLPVSLRGLRPPCLLQRATKSPRSAYVNHDSSTQKWNLYSVIYTSEHLPLLGLGKLRSVEVQESNTKRQ